MRSRCARILADLPVPEPFDVDALCDVVAKRRGRSILLIPMAGDGHLNGYWLPMDTYDRIYYEEGTTRPHQDHIILHELSHMLCGHDPESIASRPDLIAAWFPDIDPSQVCGVLAREPECSGGGEAEAELLASLILQRAGLLVVRHPEVARSNGPADRIWAAMGGW